MIDLSILVCGVHTRYDTFLPKIQKQLFDQYESLSEKDKTRVEIIVLTDNKKQMLGEKRNIMADMAQGKYIVYVDDDDKISDDYIEQLLTGADSDADCISFQAEVSLNGGTPKICYYSKDNLKDYNTEDAYYRIPNHITCVKKELSLKSSFPSIKYGEDSAYSKLLINHLKTEYKIDKVLYYYDYDERTTETQDHVSHIIRTRNQPPIVDVVILSNAKTPQHRVMTGKAVNTCLAGANSLPVNITVIEQQSGITYGNATTVHKAEPFNYNKFANFGARRGKAEWIMVANNDLLFTNGWLHALLAANHPIVSPKSPQDYRQKDIHENETGIINGRNLSGWCFMIKRELFEKIGGLDDCVDFWFSDNVVIEQVKAQGVEPMLVTNSIVHHLGSKTLHSLPPEEQQQLMWVNADIFNAKYNKDQFKTHPKYLAWKEAQ